MKLLFVVSLFIGFMFQVESSFAQGGYDGLMQKQEKKENSRWTLSDWLAQKQRIQMMDYWLAMNTSDNPFEFSIGADSGNFTSTVKDGVTTVESSDSSLQYNLAAYASIVGIEGRLVDNSDSFDGSELSFNLRILGSSQQNTNLTLEYGQYLRTASVFSVTDEEFKAAYYGGSFTLYLIKYFGFKGRYMQINPTESSNLVEMSGSRTEVEAFIDYGFLRIYGQWYTEPLEFKQSGNKVDAEREGVQAGIKLFF